MAIADTALTNGLASLAILASPRQHFSLVYCRYAQERLSVGASGPKRKRDANGWHLLNVPYYGYACLFSDCIRRSVK